MKRPNSFTQSIKKTKMMMCLVRRTAFEKGCSGTIDYSILPRVDELLFGDVKYLIYSLLDMSLVMNGLSRF